ncbi:hypothetical protein [Nocardioides sp. TF02-7]|uniref:hypothetical protein n=1 Tax=Nocardioides sp. TF02-7 TaxID=2917724 RepID=UPI001F068878|nr:hypothetical protein [Nocardioides sp. TF02-7]UMG92446.1 hypothetical protein MF408_21765 [Nocardioides sp. TF02-7]
MPSYGLTHLVPLAIFAAGLVTVVVVGGRHRAAEGPTTSSRVAALLIPAVTVPFQVYDVLVNFDIDVTLPPAPVRPGVGGGGLGALDAPPGPRGADVLLGADADRPGRRHAVAGRGLPPTRATSPTGRCTCSSCGRRPTS